MTNTTTPDVEQERAAFEDLCRKNGVLPLTKNSDGNYQNLAVEFQWHGWQAARQHSATQLAALTEHHGVCAHCEDTGYGVDTEGLLYKCPQGCAETASVKALNEKLAAAEAREAKWLDALKAADIAINLICRKPPDTVEQAEKQLDVIRAAGKICRELIDTPPDRTALDQMLAEARREERERFNKLANELIESLRKAVPTRQTLLSQKQAKQNE